MRVLVPVSSSPDPFVVVSTGPVPFVSLIACVRVGFSGTWAFGVEAVAGTALNIGWFVAAVVDVGICADDDDAADNDWLVVGVVVVNVVGCCSRVVVATGEGVGAAVDVGAQSGQRKVLSQQPRGQLLKQLVSIEPLYAPCPRHDRGVYESGKSTFRSWLL